MIVRGCPRSTVTLRLGEPQIAGATQDGETAVFLLLVANEQGE
mgnify:CR=1 FL=1